MALTSAFMEACALGASGWPDDVCLYQPEEKHQISLPDFASTLAVKTFLNMAGLKYAVSLKSNAEFMTSSGLLPVIRVEQTALSGFEAVVNNAALRGYSLKERLVDKDQAAMHAFMALVDSDMTQVEAFIAWNVDEVADEVTKQRYGSSYSWPLSWLLPWMKQRKVKHQLATLDWHKKSLSEVCGILATCCTALSNQLGQKKFFFGSEPTELDALVFGHLFAIVTTVLPNTSLSDVIKRFETLQQFLVRINEQYFQNFKLDD